MNKFPASLRSDFSHCRFAPVWVSICFGIDGDFSGMGSVGQIGFGPVQLSNDLDNLLLAPAARKPFVPFQRSDGFS
jgi:hypothetical protein